MRQPVQWLAGLDVTAAALLGAAALPASAIAISGNAGPFGAAILLPALLVALATPLVVVGVLSRVRLRSASKSGRWMVAGVVAFALSSALFPLAEHVRDWSRDRAFDRLTTRLVEDARGCAARTVAGIDDELESNPGVEIRPRMTEAALRCVEQRRSHERLSCFASACSVTLDDPDHDGRRTIGIDMRTFLDRELRTAGRPPYDRAPQPQASAYDEDGVWFE